MTTIIIIIIIKKKKIGRYGWSNTMMRGICNDGIPHDQPSIPHDQQGNAMPMMINGLKTLTARELRARKFPAPEYLLEPWLSVRESAMVYSPPGVGKSLFALSTALAIAGAGEFLGWKAPKARKTLFIDGEMPEPVLRDRMNLLADGIVAGNNSKAWERNLTLLPRMHQDIGVEFVDLASSECRVNIIKDVVKGGYEFVIFDNLSVLAEVADENDAASMHKIVEFLLDLKNAGVGTMLIHHSNKVASGYRGSSKLATSFETIIGLKHLKDAVPLGCEFKLEWSKRRNTVEADDGLPLIARLDGGVWEFERDDYTHLTRMIEVAKSGAHNTQTSVAAALGVKPFTISRMKDDAIRRGLVTAQEWREFFGRE